MSDNPWAAPPGGPPQGRPPSGPSPVPPGTSPWGTPPGMPWAPPPGPYSGYGQWPAHQETFTGLPWPPYPPPPPPRRGFEGRTLALLIVLVLVFVTGVFTVAVRLAPEFFEKADRDRRGPAELARIEAQLQAELPGLQRFVEARRGLRFKAPVDVELLDDDDFVDRLFEEEEEEESEEGERPADGDATLYAIRLIDDRDALEEIVDDAYVDTIQGFYDHRTDELVVRGAELNPLTRLVLVHELVHALQDQHFGIDLDFADFDDEREIAYRSLVEGDANRIDAMYRESLSRADQSRLDALEQAQFAGVDTDTPDVVLALLSFPYELGPEFVEELVTEAGQARLDAAFRKPPTTTEQIVDVAAFLRGEGAGAVPAPQADGKVVDQGVLGYLGLALMLDGGGPEELLSDAVEGWAGDRYVTWEKGDDVCTRATVAMSSAKDRDELLDALADEYDEDADVAPSGERSLTFHTCREE